ncbi:hypothetical protein [Ruegeria jejuensis]|uniref:hypothetical protein n=1 Tax=Ruegeria jejuensis TaxID=3233338 RepID=UPI00355AE52C
MFAILLLGSAPTLATVVGFQYLPTQEWVSQVFWVALLAGIAAGGFMLWLAPKGLAKDGNDPSPLKAILVVSFAPFLGYWLGSTMVTAGLPMIATIFTGYPVEVEYDVGDVDDGNSRYCSRPIKVEGLPFAQNSLCGFSEEFRRTLSPGSQIVVSGKGTRFGVFPAQAKRIE